MINPIGRGASLPPVRSLAAASTTAAADPVATTRKVKPDLAALGATARELAKSPPVDTAKVDRVKAAIAAGSYKVDPGAVAEKMIALDLPHNG